MEAGDSFLFGDPRRPRSLALGLLASIAIFPLIWGILVFVYAFSGGPYVSRRTSEVCAMLAASLAALAFVVVAAEWRAARRPFVRSVPRAGPRAPAEAWVSGAVVLLGLGAAVLLGAWMVTVGIAPVRNTSPPSIVGKPVIGERLVAVHGEWTGRPKAYRYQWLRCGPVSVCTPVAQAVRRYWYVRRGNDGLSIRVRVTAENEISSASVVSNATSRVSG